MSRPTAIVIGVGAEHGLGAALSRRFAAEGHHVLVAGRTPHRIDQVVRAIAEAGGSAEAVPTDTTREDEVGSLFERDGEVAGAVPERRRTENLDAAIFIESRSELGTVCPLHIDQS